MFNPFGMNTARRQAGLYNSQNQQQSPYDFKGLENRLGKIETRYSTTANFLPERVRQFT